MRKTPSHVLKVKRRQARRVLGPLITVHEFGGYSTPRGLATSKPVVVLYFSKKEGSLVQQMQWREESLERMNSKAGSWVRNLSRCSISVCLVFCGG